MVHLLAPSAPLNAKEKRGVTEARRWAERRVMPRPGPDGVVWFTYGMTLPTVVCAPLHVCDLALEPGEVVNAINAGDKDRWSITPGLSGSGGNLTTHIMLKPHDSGLVSNLIVQTNKRTYAIKLVSTRHEWMPLVGFTYPVDERTNAAAQWAAYRRIEASREQDSGNTVNGAPVQFYCIHVQQGSPSWVPRRAYTDGRKTYIDFPAALGRMAAPILVALANDGGWLSSPSKLVVNYRQIGSRYVVDAVLNRAELISGIGGSQERVQIQRGCQQ